MLVSRRLELHTISRAGVCAAPTTSLRVVVCRRIAHALVGQSNASACRSACLAVHTVASRSSQTTEVLLVGGQRYRLLRAEAPVWLRATTWLMPSASLFAPLPCLSCVLSVLVFRSPSLRHRSRRKNFNNKRQDSPSVTIRREKWQTLVWPG